MYQDEKQTAGPLLYGSSKVESQDVVMGKDEGDSGIQDGEEKSTAVKF